MKHRDGIVGEMTSLRGTLMGQEFDPILEATPLYTDSEKSVALIVLNGMNFTVKNLRSTTTYEVTSGHVTVRRVRTALSNTIEIFSEGQSFTVGPNEEYQDWGDAVMLATSTPPFNRHDEIVLGL